jgi:hypothetical protein
MRIKWSHILFIIFVIVGGNSCKKGSSEINYNPSLQVANNQVIAERAYSQVFNIFFMVVSDSILKRDGSNTIFGAQCTYQELPEIKYEIDFLPYYTSCPDDKVRKGVIVATLDKEFSETGAIATLTFSDYTVDELRLEGENEISNSGLSASMFQIYDHNIPSATITIIDSLQVEYPFHWESQKTYTYIAGSGTPENYNDDIFDISGQNTGVSVSGYAFTVSLDEALGNYFNCRWIRTGRTLLSTPNQDILSGSIEYIGEDSCINQVKYVFNGVDFYDEFIFH